MEAQRFVNLRLAGFTYQQIADKFGFSRQYIHQICKKSGVLVGTKTYRLERIANEQLAAPFMRHLDRHCVMCREIIPARVLTCAKCRAFRKAIVEAKAHLSRGPEWLTHACSIIRKFDLKPEDFKLS